MICQQHNNLIWRWFHSYCEKKSFFQKIERKRTYIIRILFFLKLVVDQWKWQLSILNIFYVFFRNGSFTSGSSNDFGADNEEEDEDDPHDPRDPRGRGSALLRVIEAGDIENSLDRPDGGPALGGKKRMLMKQGKTAMSAKHKAMMAGAAVKRLRNWSKTIQKA